MKYSWKRVLSAIVAFMLMLSMIPAMPITTQAASENDLTFELNTDRVSYSVVDCVYSASGALTIPAAYNGKPVTRIANNAFYDCYELTSITIPEGVTRIGNRAFKGCTRLDSITIPHTVTHIGHESFKYCSLTSVHITDLAAWCGIQFGSELISMDSNPLYSADILYLNGEPITDLVIPDGVTTVGFRAFSGYSGLTSVTIPDSVTGIDEGAFYGCKNLINVTIPDSVISIGKDAFYGCDSLAYNVYSDGKYLGNATNPYCALMDTVSEDITSISIKDGAVFINAFAFSGCTELTSITIPDSVTSIEKGTFNDCPIEKLMIAEGSKTITSAMVICESALQEVVIPDSVTEIGDHAFRDCTSLTSIEIPASVTSIGRSAFYQCTNLTGVTIPASVSSIGDYAFYGCANLASIAIPDGVTSIGRSAFYQCTNLTGVTIPDSVITIGDYAFNSCQGLTSVVIPDSVASIGDYAFYKCTNLNYNSYDGAKYLGGANNPYVILIQADTSNQTYGIHNNTKFIASVAFKDCTDMGGIVIPDGVTAIGRSAFSGCTNLTSITLPKSIKTIGTDAFYGCNKLAHIWYYGNENDAKSITGTKPSATWHYNYCGANNHTYDNPCDSVCNVCDYPRDVSHVYDNADDLTCNACKQTLAPAAPSYWDSLVTDTTVTLPAIDGYEYSMDAITWQASNVFTDLQPATTYTFYQRVAASADNLVSPASSPTTIKTRKYTPAAPDAPVLETKTSTSVTLQAQSGYEYSIDGYTWQASNVFTGLSPETEYTFFQRIAETDTDYASASSAPITVTTLRAFTVTYDTLGVSNAPAAQLKDQGVALVLSSTVSTYSSYLFKGWSTSPYGEVAYSGGDTYTKDEDITLYAVWAQRCYTCSGTGSISVPCSLCNGSGTWWGMISTCCYARTAYVQITHGSSYYMCRSCGKDCDVVKGGADCETTQKSVCVSCSGNGYLKRTPPAPPQPELLNATSSSISILPQPGMEYSLDGITWQTGNTFQSLTPNTRYTICQRYKESTYCYASASSAGLSVRTDNPAYTVVFKDWDDTELSRETYHWGEEVFAPVIPTRDPDDTYTYTFVGWDKPVVDCAGNATYTATYTSNYIDYTVVFENWNGDVLSSKIYHYGDAIVVPNAPAKEKDSYYMYTFGGWDKEVVNCEGNAVYQALFTAEHYHTYTDKVNAPICTDKGYTTHTCHCGDSYVDSYVNALGHSFTNYHSNNDATCTEDGTETSECDRCEETHTRKVEDSATGHSHNVVAERAPTCTEDGYTTYTCHCGDTYTWVIPATGNHTYDGVCDMNCNICGDIRTVPHVYDNACDTECNLCGYQSVNLKITHVTLRPEIAGLYFTGSFEIAEAVPVVRKGIVASVYGALPVADGTDPNSHWSEGTTSVLVTNILNDKDDDASNQNRAAMTIFARAYVELEDGSYVYSDVTAVNLQEVAEAADAQWATLNAIQKEAFVAMYKKFQVILQTWNIQNAKQALLPKKQQGLFLRRNAVLCSTGD